MIELQVTTKELYQHLREICREHHCDRSCPVYNYRRKMGFTNCDFAFINGIMAGHINLNGSTASPRKHTDKVVVVAVEDIPKHEVPSWCVEGQWVTPKVLMRPMKILRVDRQNLMVDLEMEGDSTRCGASIDDYLPIKFREPTFQEATAFIGKILTYPDNRKSLVMDVRIGDGSREGVKTMFINGTPLARLQECSIDGAPVGTPELDRDALGKDEQ